MRWTRNQLRAIADEKGLIRRKGITVRIYENGTILRADPGIDLSILRAVTVTEAVRALGLPPTYDAYLRITAPKPTEEN